MLMYISVCYYTLVYILVIESIFKDIVDHYSVIEVLGSVY